MLRNAKNKKLRFLRAILTGKERQWLLNSMDERALRFRRLRMLLQGVPGDEKIENMMAWALFEVIKGKLAYVQERSARRT